MSRPPRASATRCDEGRGRTFDSCRAHRRASGGLTGGACSPRGQLALRRQRPHVRIVPGAWLNQAVSMAGNRRTAKRDAGAYSLLGDHEAARLNATLPPITVMSGAILRRPSASAWYGSSA
jgi:hypothetical protein